ncbi:MAG: hypothetical protein GX633_02730, partial [Clostridiales bacterium]|nr:hypothetical protein [Clostridiales bacterium]
MKMTDKRSFSMFSGIIVSFLLILIIPLISTMVMYNHAYKELREEVIQSSMAAMEQFSYTFDEKLSSVFNTIRRVQTDDEVLSLISADAMERQNDPYRIYSARNRMNVAKTANIEDLFVYFKSRNVILSPYYSIFDPENYEKTYYVGADNLSKTLMSIQDHASMLILPFNKDAKVSTIGVFQTVTVGSYKNKYAIIGSVMDYSTIVTMLNSYS